MGASDRQGALGNTTFKSWALFLALSLVVALSVWVGGEIGARQAVREVEARLPGAAALSVLPLESELGKQHVTGRVLADDPDVRNAVRDPSREKLAALNTKFERLQKATEAAVIYLVGASGFCTSASNWNLPSSFVGFDYRFRDYYRDALSKGETAQYAMGKTSLRPGAYLATRVADTSGVLVVKVVFDRLEQEWRQTGNRIFVTDADNVILLASEPDWRFHTFGPVAPSVIARIRDADQFGAGAALTPLALRQTEAPALTWNGQDYLRRVVPVRGTPWMLHLLVPLDEPAKAGARAGRALAGGIAVLILVASGLATRRLRRARASAAEAAAFNARLRREVEARTADLNTANTALRAEVNERRAAEEKLARMQNERAQANRLATLGQIAAGVAHEINQPLAAIRAYADNGRAFLSRGNPDSAARNLELIGGLTEKIGTITDELRAFSRKTPGHVTTVALADAIEGAMVLMGPRLRQAGIHLEDRTADRDISVRADRLRLEQILVNLIQNAVEALTGVADPRIALDAETREGRVLVTVRDNGPGIAPELVDRLFTPFVTGKPMGLGLGLVVSQDLAKDFGGQLSGGNDPAGGGRFVLELQAVSPS